MIDTGGISRQKSAPELVKTNSQSSSENFSSVSPTQPLIDSERFIAILEKSLSRSIEREQILRFKLAELTTEYLGLRVDILRNSVDSADPLTKLKSPTFDHIDPERLSSALRSPVKLSKLIVEIYGSLYPYPKKISLSIVSRIKNKIFTKRFLCKQTEKVLHKP